MNASSRRLVYGSLALLGLLCACGETHPDKLIQPARESLAKNQPQAAILQLTSLLQDSPDLSQARLLLGQAYLDSGDPAAAETELRKAMALGVPELAVMPLLARVLIAKGEAQTVIQQFATVTLADPTAEADLKTSLATAHGRNGAPQEAMAALNLALQSVPDYPPALLVKARSMAEQRNLVDAARHRGN